MITHKSTHLNPFLSLLRKKNMLSNNVNSIEKLQLKLKLIELDVPKIEKMLSSD
jgi:hypothetical protein